MNKDKIMNRLAIDYEYLTLKGYEVVFVALQGSQNYGIDYENSDIDTKAVILPIFNDIILGNQPISTTMVLDTNEHIDIKDIRLMFECFKKQNINYLEILFTEYKLINTKYEKFISALFEKAEDIAHYDNYKAVNCIAGMVEEKYKALEHPYPTIKDRIDKYGYDSKQLQHMIRCNYFLNNYINKMSYAQCLTTMPKEWMIKIKKQPPCYDLQTARAIANFYRHTTRFIKNEYINSHKQIINEEVDELLNNILCDCIKISLNIEE